MTADFYDQSDCDVLYVKNYSNSCMAGGMYVYDMDNSGFTVGKVLWRRNFMVAVIQILWQTGFMANQVIMFYTLII